jgi:ssDNA-binding Zn-finger/Zn-ribbon topoisomerase 1
MTCPICGKPMVKRTGKYGEFFGCSGFPNCKYTMSMENDDISGCQDDYGINYGSEMGGYYGI